ncbi:hypothetical protein JZ751_001701 [Albula glossodonta]|uniref:Uncharacterized protein n=1 Tax=Albula glossodonta TaxID=121402 RepID=A0A8T2PUN6_9TELE|nr:hypothetical protein JZ751_001701 [Albula glossodonta]
MADICIQENSTGAMGDIAFKLLPIILLQPEYRTAKKMCRPSIDEAKKSFIDWIPASTDVTEYLRHTELERSHPFILQLGPARTFAVVHGQALEQGTLLTAVDVCFKAFHCFDINFPKQCAPVWEFLQHAVYGIVNGKPAAGARVLQSFIFN